MTTYTPEPFSDEWMADQRLAVADHEERQRERNLFLYRWLRWYGWADRHHSWGIPIVTRIAVLIRSQRRCETCGRGPGPWYDPKADNQTKMDMHHLHYRTVGHEDHVDLLLLCRHCHMQRHGW